MALIIPEHIAIIMDGNGRWAKNRSMPRTYGHRSGAKSLRKILTHAGKLGVKYLTVYAFSTENWSRSDEEVSSLMELFSRYLKSEEKEIVKNNIKFVVSGSKNRVDANLLAQIRHLEELTKDNTGIVFNVAFNYGGRDEIIHGINRLLAEKKENITEAEFGKYLYRDIPDPELLIRTGGEYRVSNFLLWQIAYTEIVVSDTLWPDFDEKELDKAIEEFNRRDRRFGGE